MDWTAFQHQYLQNAVVAGFCAGITCGVVGVFIVTTHLSFLGVCLAHAAFAGALMGVWLDFHPLLGALAFSVLATAMIGPLADRGELSPDTSTGIVFSLMLGLAFLFLGMTPGSRTQALSLFWGSILTLTRADLLFLVLVMAGLLVLLTVFYKEVHAVVCHRDVATAVGIPATLVFYAMLLATGVTISVSLQSIGGLLIYSLILNPAAAAYQLAYSFKRMLVLAAVFGVGSCWAGLFASFAWDLPAGAAIVIASAAVFGLSTLFSPKRAAARLKPSKAEE